MGRRIQNRQIIFSLHAFRLLVICLALLLKNPVFAQTVTTLNVTDTAPGGVIADNTCALATTSQIVRTFTVGSNFIVGDLDLGVLLTHTYRSDLRIYLTSPAGTVVNVMTWTGNVQSGDNLNDLFDDQAAAAIGTHNATVTDPTTAPYSHSFQPSNPLSAFNGQSAAGTWALRICDAVASDTGNFLRADLYLTSTSLSVTKTSTVISDGISVSSPKAIPGAVISYCILVTNNGRATAPNATVAHSAITVTDVVPASETYVSSSLMSGTSCATAATPEAGTGPTLTVTTPSLAPTATYAIVYRVTVN